MTPTMRRALARESFASKIEKVGQLIRLATKLKTARGEAKRSTVQPTKRKYSRSHAAGILSRGE